MGACDDNLYAFKAAYGQIWKAATGGFIESPPVVANGVVYAGSDDGNLYALGLPRGQESPDHPDPVTLRPSASLVP
jgi:outer membrane protein assembly factor BamB